VRTLLTPEKMMVPRATIEPVRALYLEQFRRVVSATANAQLEPALRNSDGALATDGKLRLPYRPDLLPRSGGPSITIDAPERARIQPCATHYGSTQISVAPFSWDGANVSVLGDDGNWVPARQWFYRWFDPEDKNVLNEEGFHGVVHFMSDPEAIKGGASVTIDFGSAPIEAFDSLLEALVTMRPRRIEVA
jgi:hypothetical protein